MYIVLYCIVYIYYIYILYCIYIFNIYIVYIYIIYILYCIVWYIYILWACLNIRYAKSNPGCTRKLYIHGLSSGTNYVSVNLSVYLTKYLFI